MKERKKPSFVLSEHPCLVHGDPFRAAKCERVRGLECPYCVRGERVVTLAFASMPAMPWHLPSEPESATVPTRTFERREVEWAIEGARGCALAWSEVL